MPLLNNFEIWEAPMTGAVSRETLRNKFPEFFSENPKGVKVHALDHMFSRVKRVQQDTNVPMGIVRKAPEPTGHKATANIIVDGKQVNLQYSSSMPIVGAFSKTFAPGGNRVQLKHGMMIQPNQEDLLFFLYFGMDVFTNCAKPSRLPKYEFYKPEVKAAETISKWRKEQELKTLIYNTLSDEMVLKAMKGLAIDPKETPDMNRTSLLTAVQGGNPLYVTTFHDLVKTAPAATGSVDVQEIVDTLVSDGKIKNEEGKWFAMSKLKIGEWNTQAFYNTKESNADESRLLLIEHLKVNEILLNKINS